MNVGATVNIFFAHAEPLFEVYFEHEPRDTGDSWIFTSEDGAEHRVMVFERMDVVCEVPSKKNSPEDDLPF